MAGILGQLQGALSRVFGGSKGGSTSVVGIDIGSSTIKAVQIKKEKGKAILETYGEIALGPYAQVEMGRATRLPAEQIGEALKALMGEANITASRTGVSIPFSSSLTSVFEMPPMSDQQLAEMIPLEARKYIPVNANEVMMDWFVIPQDEGYAAGEEKLVTQRNKEILLVAIHNDTLANFQTITSAAALNANFFELEIFGTMRSALRQDAAPVMIVDMGAATTKVYIVERGIVRISHLINIGAQDLTLTLSRALGMNFDRAEREKREKGLIEFPDPNDPNARIRQALLSTLGRVFSDVNRVLLSYGKKYNKNISKIVLTGGGAGLPGLREYVATQINAEIEIGTPFEKIESPAFLEEVLTTVGPEFAVAVGVALRALNESA